MNVTIRPAAPDDADDIGEVRVVTWRATYRGMLPDPVLDGLNLADEIRRYREAIGHLPPDRTIFVAEVDSPARRVVGFCFCGPDGSPDHPDYGEIYALYVLPEYQGEGIGRALFQAGSQWLAGRSYQHMIIFVLRANTSSRKFYEAVGGKLEREKRDEVRGYLEDEVGYGYAISL